MFHTRVVNLLLCAYYYYYYYYLIYLNSLLLLLLLLLEMYGESITITITIAWDIEKAYYYYYYFSITITSLLLLNQRNTTQADYKVTFKDLYYFHGITHYHRHIITDNIIIILSWKFCGLLLSNIRKVIVYYWQMRPPITITITDSLLYYYYYYYSGILRSLLLLLSCHNRFITITITISNSLTTLFHNTNILSPS